MRLTKKIIVLLICCATAGTALGNGYSVSFVPMPEYGLSLFLQGKRFGLASMSDNNQIFLYYDNDYLGDDDAVNKTPWINSPLFAKEMIGKEISLFGTYGYIGNADCYQKKPEHEDDFAVACRLKEECLGEIKKLPKHMTTFFMCPALDKLAPPPVDKNHTEKEKELISSHTYNSICNYIREYQVDYIHPKFDVIINNIEKIGAKGPVSQFFIETKVGTAQAIKTHEAHVFSFVIEIRDDKVVQRLFGFLRGGSDSSGYIRLDAMGDINQDGLVDIFYIRNKIILFDGDKWILLWEAHGC